MTVIFVLVLPCSSVRVERVERKKEKSFSLPFAVSQQLEHKRTRPLPKYKLIQNFVVEIITCQNFNLRTTLFYNDKTKQNFPKFCGNIFRPFRLFFHSPKHCARRPLGALWAHARLEFSKFSKKSLQITLLNTAKSNLNFKSTVGHVSLLLLILNSCNAFLLPSFLS